MTTLASTEQLNSAKPEEAQKPTNVLMSSLNWLDENFEKPFLFMGMLSIILIIVFQTFYRYIGAYFSTGAAGAIWTEESAHWVGDALRYWRL